MGKWSGRNIMLVALCAGLLAALLAYLFLGREKARAAEMTEPVKVVVATQDLATRTLIEPGMVREAIRPLATLPTNCATSPQEVLGRVTTAALAADEPVRRSVLAARSGNLGLAYVVPEGMRAVTVAVDPIIGVAGFLKAGNHVDVLATFEADQVSLTKTVLQDVELLAIGPEVVPGEVNRFASGRSGRPKEQPNATFALSPEDAEKLILAESKGKLRLTLRSVGDGARIVLSGVRSDNLIGVRPGATVAAGPRATARIMSAGYTSPAFLGGYPAYSAPQPQAITLGKTAEQEKERAVTVETVRGTQKTTVDVRSE